MTKAEDPSCHSMSVHCFTGRRQTELITMLATEASEEAATAAAAQQPPIVSPPSEAWIAGSDVDNRGAFLQSSSSSSKSNSPSADSSRDSGGRRPPQAEGDMDSVDNAFLSMERRSLEAAWK